ncbi:hypothetical protein [Vibrio sp. D431a]|uniref:hypothetical protein n=1 Tax=Vibrio sp. D431a TaxID=2837388 RepID=UPI0025565246|nr:hypothetical protein [Vibrio sp. D431a]MDK9793348.1 hypothetical protein [Vibrio sp. D431a]
MSVTSSKVYNPKQVVECFRVYRRIDGVEYQEYYRSKEVAEERDAELGLLLDMKHPITNYNLNFVHPHNQYGKGYDIGVNGVYLRLEKSKGSVKYYRLVLSIAQKSDLGQSHTTASLGNYYNVADWLSDAVRKSHAKSNYRDSKSALKEGLQWALSQEAAESITSELECLIKQKGISREDVKMHYSFLDYDLVLRSIKLHKAKPSGSLSLSLSIDNPYEGLKIRRQIKFTSYRGLFNASAELTAYILMFTMIGEESPWEYAEACYMMMLTKWRAELKMNTNDSVYEYKQHDLSHQNWFKLVNSYGNKKGARKLLK